MHGFIFSEIKRYADTKVDRSAWLAILAEADLKGHEYESFLEYPDEEAVAIVVAASRLTSTPVPALLEDFGAFLGANLFKIYKPIIKPEWKTLDFLMNIEETIHHVVRTRNKQARPPVLDCARTDDQEVQVIYRSERKMCDLAKGIIRGVSEHYGEAISLSEDRCMKEGAESCLLRVVVA